MLREMDYHEDADVGISQLQRIVSEHVQLVTLNSQYSCALKKGWSVMISSAFLWLLLLVFIDLVVQTQVCTRNKVEPCLPPVCCCGKSIEVVMVVVLRKLPCVSIR
jgi:hypothetical protein